MSVRKTLLSIAAALLAAPLCWAQMLEERPNVVLVVVDDAGYGDFGFMGGKDIKSPNLDALANEGVLLTNGYATASVGAPSRAAILTGRYQQRSGFETSLGEGHGLNPAIKTLAEMFEESGYKTAAIGKWGLGSEEQFRPTNRGFGEFYGFLGTGRSYFANNKQDSHTATETVVRHNDQFVVPSKYLTYEFGDQALKFIAENRSNPIFLYLSFSAMHAPAEATKEDLARFDGHKRKSVAAMTYALDQAVGGVVERLKADGRFDNTLIIVVGDNGGAYDNGSSNRPLKGGKGSVYDGGVRVPFVVTYGDRLKGGAKYDKMCSTLDIFATAIAAAQIEYYNPKAPLDGVDLLPYLAGERKDAPHEALFWSRNGTRAVRSGDYKYISTDGVGEVLYNTVRNPQEDEDLMADSVVQGEQLKALLEEWQSQMTTPAQWSDGEWSEVTKQMHRELMANEEVKTLAPGDLKGKK